MDGVTRSGGGALGNISVSPRTAAPPGQGGHSFRLELSYIPKSLLESLLRIDVEALLAVGAHKPRLEHLSL